MVFDNIFNASKYFCLHKHFEKAFDYITSNNFNILPSGKYEIDGEDCFALVNRYTTKKVSESFAESHKKYIDIQFMVNGKEKIGTGNIQNFHILEFNEQTDLLKLEGNLDFLNFNEGDFAILYPEDVHMPGIAQQESSDVLKVVIKVAV